MANNTALHNLVDSLCSGSNLAPSAAPATQPKANKDYWGHDRFLPELTSGDEARVAKALADIQAMSVRSSYKWRATPMFVLLDAKMYAQADAMALRVILLDPFHADSVAALEKFRARAFLAAGKPADALAAAKGYFNTALLKDTGDAIDMIANYLIKTRPDTPELGREFKRQQVAWTTNAPSTHPGASQAGDLGPAILATIPIDPAPFESGIAKFNRDDYHSLVSRGNLLLLADKTKEAHAAFEQAYLVVPENKAAEAIENVARSIRADAGCIAPANAYILSERTDADQPAK